MSNPLYILVLCTGNSARSILAEALLNHLGHGRVKAFSAGSTPTGRVNPFALEVLAEAGIKVSDPRSKSWDEFSGPGAPEMDVVITVCDNAAGEVCPIWPGRPIKVHWGFPDPAAVTGTDEEKLRAFRQIKAMIGPRIEAMLALDLETLATKDMKAGLAALAPEKH